MSVSCECCVLLGRGLRVDRSLVLCVSECDREASIRRRPWPTGGPLLHGGVAGEYKRIQEIPAGLQ